ncbi:MAG: aldo/keto reductase [Acidobacteriota bacterium]|nr:aldo/keto reductase [Acidobacteriota bacterium]
MKTKGNFGRRDFLKTGLAGAAVLGVPAALRGVSPVGSGKAAATVGDRPFIYRTLGKTGLKLPVVSMGVMNADNPDLVRAALESGMLHLDTAHGYQRGRNEVMIGEVLKGRPRDSYTIATKVPGPGRDKSMADISPSEQVEIFRKNFTISLERLGLDYVDIFYLHNVDNTEFAALDYILEALAQEKKDGRARFVGITTHRNEPEIIRAAIACGGYDVVLTAYNFRQDHKDEIRKAIAEAAGAGLGVVAMKTQAGVYWDKEKQDPINMSAALKWALNDENVHMAIPGFTTFDQMETDLAVMADLTLTEKEWADLRLDRTATASGLFCQQCNQCVPGCPQALPIPDLMRGYMYAWGYKNIQAGYDLVASLNVPESPCSNCATCTAHCVKGMDIGARVKDAVRLRTMPDSLFV